MSIGFGGGAEIWKRETCQYNVYVKSTTPITTANFLPCYRRVYSAAAFQIGIHRICEVDINLCSLFVIRQIGGVDVVSGSCGAESSDDVTDVLNLYRHFGNYPTGD